MRDNPVLDALVGELTRLPGIGTKTADRLAHHLLKVSKTEALALAEAIRRLKEELTQCELCHNIADQSRCHISRDPERDASILCVVEQVKDLYVIEESGAYRGLYHVLGGNISPLENRGADTLTVDSLRARLQGGDIREVILATNPDFEGDGTAMLVAHELATFDVLVSRLGRGVPTGSQLEYMNRSIITDAIEARQRVARDEEPHG